MNFDNIHGFLKTTNKKKNNKNHKHTTNLNVLPEPKTSLEKISEVKNKKVSSSNFKVIQKEKEIKKHDSKDAVLENDKQNKNTALKVSSLELGSRKENNVSSMFSKGKKYCESNFDDYEEMLSSIKKYLKEKKRKYENKKSDKNGVMFKLAMLAKLYNSVDTSSNVDSEKNCCPDEDSSTTLNENMLKRFLELMVS